MTSLLELNFKQGEFKYKFHISKQEDTIQFYLEQLKGKSGIMGGTTAIHLPPQEALEAARAILDQKHNCQAEFNLIGTFPDGQGLSQCNRCRRVWID